MFTSPYDARMAKINLEQWQRSIADSKCRLSQREIHMKWQVCIQLAGSSDWVGIAMCDAVESLREVVTVLIRYSDIGAGGLLIRPIPQ